MRVVFAAAAIVAAAASSAQDRAWAIYAGPSSSVQFLGGEDHRHGFIVGVQTGRVDPRVTFRGKEGELVWDAYFLRSKGEHIDEHPSEFANAFGVIATGRYWFDNHRWFVDAGFGIQVQDKTSVDLDTYINTTPTLGAGYIFPMHGADLQLTFRFMHISNGGTNKPNQGQNHLQILLGARF